MPSQKVAKKGRDRKEPFIHRLEQLFIDYPAVLVVSCNNIGSAHMQKIKKTVNKNNDAVFIKGKNTLIRKAIRLNSEKHAEWGNIVPLLKGNVGLVFGKGDLSGLKKTLVDMRVSAPAKVGILAPQDVIIEKGATGLEPTKTSFLQALNIASKINRGQIEILQDIVLIKMGSKVGSSESTLLTMLNKKPFSYGLICTHVYEDGKVYLSKFLDINSHEVLARFSAGISTVAAISLSTGLPSIASVPHSILNGYKNLLAICLETSFVFEQAVKIKEMVENPDAFISNVVVEEKPVEKVVEVPVEEVVVEEVKKEDSSEDMGFTFFDE